MSKRKRLSGQPRLNRLAALADRDGWACRYCGIGLAPTNQWTTIDEWVPLVRGGSTIIDNQVLACYSCNGAKADMTGWEYLQHLDGRTPPSYEEWQVEMKRQQREAMFQLAGVKPPMERRPLAAPLAEFWPIERCSHSSAAAFCLNCAGRKSVQGSQ